MSQAQNPLETTQGYAPPTVTQFSVFLDNRVGRLRSLLQAFSEKPYCRLHAVTVHEASDHAVVRLITSDAAGAIVTLREDDFAFAETEVLVVEIADHCSIAGMCAALVGAELNIQFIYPLFGLTGRAPAVALAVDDPTLAGQILRRKGYELLGESDLAIS
ncbi:MAG: acetolactate synthase [Planctomycetota bacterium]|nr:MAG: acetolactate synthase [Planctomycetota bacterium]